MTGFLASIIQDSRPREQASIPPSGIGGAGTDRIHAQADDLYDQAALAVSPQLSSAGGDSTPFSAMTAPSSASSPPLPRSSHFTPQLVLAGALSGDSKPVNQDQVSDPVPEERASLRSLVDPPPTGMPLEAIRSHLNPADATSNAGLEALSPDKVLTPSAGLEASTDLERETSGLLDVSFHGASAAPSVAGDRAAAIPLPNPHLRGPDRPFEQDGHSSRPPLQRAATRSDADGAQLLDHRPPPTAAKTDQPQPMDLASVGGEGETAMRDRLPRVFAHGQPGRHARDEQSARATRKSDAWETGSNPGAAEPKVHIGRVDVTVTAPATPNVRAPRSAASQRINRQYLRRV